MSTGRRDWITWFTVPLLFFVTGSVPVLFARDYPDPLEVIHPLYQVEGRQSRVLSGDRFSGRMWFDQATLVAGPRDDFVIGVQGMSRIVNWRNTTAAGLHFSSLLKVGPLQPGDEPQNIAEWWLNAVHYQYGLHISHHLQWADLVVGYRRTSLHPFQPAFSQVSRDQVLVGLIRENRYVDAGLIFRYTDMWDFWESGLPDPRTQLSVEFIAAAEYSLTQRVYVFGEAQPRFRWNRFGSPVDIEPIGRAGLRFGENASWIRMYLHIYYSSDTEQIAGDTYPVTLFGFGFEAGGSAEQEPESTGSRL
ncbi:MAG: hypothetical protein ACOC0D_03595 [Spirochaeta sp.]